MSERLYIIAAKRTPLYRPAPASGHTALTLGIAAARAALLQSGAESSDLDAVILGQSLPAGLGMGVARQMALAAGIPGDIPASSVNMAALSGMKALIDACVQIKSGDADLILTIAADAASHSGFLLPAISQRGHLLGLDLLLHDAQESRKFPLFHHAEQLARRTPVPRGEQDDFARASLQRAALAQENGHHDSETVQPDSSDTRDALSEHATPLAQLRPLIDGGSITAGNSAALADGASAILIASENALRRFGLAPLAEISGYGFGGIDPERGALGATPAIAQALERGDCRLEQIDRLEIEETFAAEVLAILRELGEEHEIPVAELLARTNPGGGAIALGHPLACAGHRLVTTLTYGLARDNHDLGLAAQGSADGLGTAILLRRL
ncbi:MAG: thiolase family protein [Cardiobacteriaceae bacterium]|nr:thiolase family protein [Cardiobacteriaceae bacterium]